ncbi:hypothetical protein CANARDRAFT_5866 [[Candida] arabinofermentans NRRL YB-2248]|uniref:Fructose-bisphosphate aldolase n=1 Tax=[Candida] arabinofermentans NRRL YB-2248 TaxID=983967 RepID=A0A1E4T6D4_9ASCO|nr:hypothetical protein CANARDRAFT_5866 [[Candida] arabinofermentans NRRL YB-2248]
MDNTTSWKINNKTLRILRAAEEGGYGVLAAVAYTMDQAMAMIRAAETKRSPLMLLMFPWAITSSRGELAKAFGSACNNASVPVALHLDHAQDIELVKFAARELPFDSIMVDMSHYEKHENLSLTKELVEYCNSYKKATEAEPGRIEGGEDGVGDTIDLEGILTTPEEADLFINTGIDIIAPAFGNFHGDYPKTGPQLRWDILEKLEKYVKPKNIRVCLHGTNDFTPELIKRNVELGVSKINVNKLVLDTYLSFFKANASITPFTELLDTADKLLEDRMEFWIDQCGSANKADDIYD